MQLLNELNNISNLIDKQLYHYLDPKDIPQKLIYDAMEYSLMSKGKRIRPALCLFVSRLLEANEHDVIPFACAIEMIHTYSLIHDDLPAMDNDDYRRGKLSNHKVFGEGIAILAGDALLNTAFEIMLDKAIAMEGNTTNILLAIKEIAKSSGVYGMIGGQTIDLDSEGKNIDKQTLNYMHRCKTGALIKASVLTPAIIFSCPKDKFVMLSKYAENIGLAFQIKDDILNIEGDSEKIGKSINSDVEKGKTTFVSVYGVDTAKEILNDTINDAIDSLSSFGYKADFLIQLANYIGQREI